MKNLNYRDWVGIREGKKSMSIRFVLRMRKNLSGYHIEYVEEGQPEIHHIQTCYSYAEAVKQYSTVIKRISMRAFKPVAHCDANTFIFEVVPEFEHYQIKK